MEEFRNIKGYEGLYQVSNLGNVKSLSRIVCNKRRCYTTKEQMLKNSINNRGYCIVVFRKEKKPKSYLVHQLVAMAFLNHTICGHKSVVDHINDIKTDNRVENLQIVTARYNTRKTQGKYSSKYKGVCWAKNANKWISSITINGKQKHLGLFENEHEAHLAYQEALKKL